tara:strand:+ start:1140 stop:1328 length:189 start_codon:yes stop_codon:yes gene_type:complete
MGKSENWMSLSSSKKELEHQLQALPMSTKLLKLQHQQNRFLVVEMASVTGVQVGQLKKIEDE